MLKWLGQKQQKSTLPLPSPRSVLTQADDARDQKAWGEAAALYRAHLAANPKDWRIAVQLGHALKEAGDLDGAEAAYNQALTEKHDDADLHLQVGHLKKLRGHRRESVISYSRALDADPGLSDAYAELAGLGELRLAFRILDSRLGREHRIVGTVYEIGDLLVYFQNHTRVSGIQRVQVELCRHFIKLDNGVRFVTLFPSGLPVEIDRDGLQRLITMIDSEAVTVQELKLHIEGLLRAARPAHLGRGACLVILGAFWVMPFAMRTLAQLSGAGVTVGVYVYDLIPLTHPEFCDETLVHNFGRAFMQMAFIADFFLTISEATREDVEAECKRIGVSAPAQAVPLAHDLPFDADSTNTDGWLRRHELDEPYVLVVSTIEARKNHGLLFHLWRRLQRQHGDALPKLVFVGRAGWRVSDLMAQLKATRNVDGRIVILNGLSNQELTTLYRHCLFTVFPSFVEGWGLPVGESLMFGKPCAASGTSSIPEVGGALVDYFDPWNLGEAEHVISRLLFDDRYRADREARIAADFKPRSWVETADHFAASCRKLAPEKPAQGCHGAPTLEPATLYTVGHSGTTADGQRALAELACPIADWHEIEPWGVWAAKAEAGILFRAQSAEPVDVFLLLQSSPTRPGHLIEVRDGNDPAAKPVMVRRGYARVTCSPDGRGLLRVVVATVYEGDAVTSDHDARDIHAGLVAFGYGAAGFAETTPLEDIVDLLETRR